VLWLRFHIVILFSFIAMSFPSLAGKSNLPFYQDPFDMAAGSASLTRASRDGRLYSNPALLPVGGGFHRWIGFRLSAWVNQGACELAANPCPLSVGSSATESTTESTESGNPLDGFTRKPIGAGFSSAFSWITSLYGMSLILPGTLNIDLNATKIGKSGFYELDAEIDYYAGLQTGFAVRSPLRWLYFGVAPKAIINSNPTVSLKLADVSISDPEALAKTTNEIQQTLLDGLVPKLGVGADLGVFMLFQGSHVDYSLALKSDDVGSTALNKVNFDLGSLAGAKKSSGGTEDPAEATVPSAESGTTAFKEVRSIGTGLTFHTKGDQIHLSLDYRDLDNVYEEPLFKRVYAGVKLTLRSYVGLAAGIAHGYVTYGAELDFIFLKVNVASFAREMSKKPGLRPRRYFMFSINSGF
jgi:hypothetical protein